MAQRPVRSWQRASDRRVWEGGGLTLAGALHASGVAVAGLRCRGTGGWGSERRSGVGQPGWEANEAFFFFVGPDLLSTREILGQILG